MDERDLEEEGNDREGEGWGIIKYKGYFWNFLELLNIFINNLST
jgi:hypothetical protein